VPQQSLDQRRTIKKRTPVEKEIHDPDAHWYTLPTSRTSPFGSGALLY